MSDTYSAVDASPHAERAVLWQEQMSSWPAVAAYKATMDARIGLDLSVAMADRARTHRVPTIVGDAHQLPVADGVFAAVRSDRVLQHLEHPLVALREMHRVLRPGGRLVVADQDTWSISVPGVPDRITDAVRRLRRDVGYRNGRLASSIAGSLASMAMTDVRVDAVALVLTDPELAFGLPGWVEHWREEAGFTTADGALWRRQLTASSDAGFVFAVTFLVTSATKV